MSPNRIWKIPGNGSEYHASIEASSNTLRKREPTLYEYDLEFFDGYLFIMFYAKVRK